ncbi:uncharacterized protein [Antedon mediterranea]|uniref:uncharacterized protein isoform X2 n=1 Tax=Antedon mediterranea TaxID=105859 RepID=UPI003AF4B63B
METNSTTACSSINEEQSVVVHSNVYGENSRKPEPDLALPPTEEKPSTKGADQYSPTLTENSINNERSSLLIEEKCWDTESGVNPICDNQDKVVGLNEKINDAKENDLVQQEGYIAMSENGEHCVFIPAEQVEEDILMRATSDTRVILTPKQENEIEDSGHLIDDARRSQPHQMENHFQQIKQEAPAVQTAMPTITLTKHDSLGHPTRFHQEQNAMMMNFHQGQTDPDQTSQLPVHNQYNPSMPLHHHFSSPRRGNRQQMSTQSVPYSSHALSNRATYPNINSVIHMPQNQVHFNSGLTMQNYGQLPPISTLQPGAVENQTLSHPPMNSTVHPQTSIIAGGSGDTVIYSSPVKSEHNYNQYMMKAPIMTTISPLKTDLVIQNNDPISSGEEQSVSPLYRMDGRPSQGLVQQVLHVFKICKKTEMQPCEVYHELTKLYPLYTTYHGQKKKSWMSSVRHALTHPAFKSRRADENKNESHRKGCFWSINDNYNPQAPLPRRRRKVQRKVNYSNNQQVQYMMMPMAMSNEQMMGPQNATAFSSMMPDKSKDPLAHQELCDMVLNTVVADEERSVLETNQHVCSWPTDAHFKCTIAIL